MSRGGFTMVEMIIAILILTVAILALAGSATRLGRVSADTEVRALALQVVEDRIALIRLQPLYTKLDSIYGETGTSIPGMDGFTRRTSITRVEQEGEGDRMIDFTRVTVTVDGPILSTPISRTVVVSPS